MLIITTPIQLHAKKVVADLASKNGLRGVSEYSPYEGMNNILDHFSADFSETTANIEDLFSRQKDFDADAKQPHLDKTQDWNPDKEKEEYENGEPFDPIRDNYRDFSEYFRRLEDIKQEYIEEYIGNLRFAIVNKSGSDGLIAYGLKHKIQPTLVSLDDNEDITELADLLVDEDTETWSMSEKEAAKQRLPYILKRLDNLSMQMQVHALSFISSYLIAKEKNRLKQIAGSTMTLKPNAVIAECVYTYKVPGYIDKKVEVSNKNKHVVEMFDWITGQNPKYASYLDDVSDLLHYCDVLNIDLKNDDMSKYDNKFMSKLVVTTLTPNKQYNRDVFNCLAGNTVHKSEDSTDLTLETISTFNEILSVNPAVKEYIKYNDYSKPAEYMDYAIQIHYAYMLITQHVCTNKSDYTWRQGYLYYKDDLAIVSSDMIATECFIHKECIFSETGFVVNESDLGSLYTLPVGAALCNMKMLKFGDADVVYSKWSRYST